MSIDPDVLLSALEDDDDVRRALKTLALSAIEEAQDILDTGIAGVKMQVIRSMLPAMTKALSQRDDKEFEELKATVGSMYELIASQIAPVEPDVVALDVPDD